MMCFFEPIEAALERRTPELRTPWPISQLQSPSHGANQGWGVGTLVVLLSIGLFFAGVRSISLLGYSSLPNSLRILSAISGLISLILAALVALLPGYGELTLLMLVSFGLIVYGFGRIFIASTLKATVGWLRGMMVAVGVFDVILS
ncbi:MAG TPA: hypothetical protein VMT01_00380, partial [Candidatus Acidoferrum sp.]|nr:hypothetical protein [Candidatus Acidoferrum sp.]